MFYNYSLLNRRTVTQNALIKAFCGLNDTQKHTKIYQALFQILVPLPHERGSAKGAASFVCRG